MQLPGGVWHNDQRNRQFTFKPLTGSLELTLAEVACSNSSLPDKVTQVLSATLDQLAGQAPTFSSVETLCVADRQFIMRFLSIYLGSEQIWLTARCEHCEEQFDFMVNISELPVKEAGEGFPFASVETALGTCRIRVPNGADQRAIVSVENGKAALRILLERCMVQVPGELNDGKNVSDFIEKINPDDLRNIETAVEEVAPEIACMAQAACPECREVNVIGLDPYICLQQRPAKIFSEIHTLASIYHWSESDILSMTKMRRQRYLKLIDRSRGMID